MKGFDELCGVRAPVGGSDRALKRGKRRFRKVLVDVVVGAELLQPIEAARIVGVAEWHRIEVEAAVHLFVVVAVQDDGMP